MAVSVPAVVDSSVRWLDVDHDFLHGCGIYEPGVMSCWARNDEGQLGVGDRDFRARRV
jgi:hypothetical protein